MLHNPAPFNLLVYGQEILFYRVTCKAFLSNTKITWTSENGACKRYFSWNGKVPFINKRKAKEAGFCISDLHLPFHLNIKKRQHTHTFAVVEASPDIGDCRTTLLVRVAKKLSSAWLSTHTMKLEFMFLRVLSNILGLTEEWDSKKKKKCRHIPDNFVAHHHDLCSGKFKMKGRLAGQNLGDGSSRWSNEVAKDTRNCQRVLPSHTFSLSHILLLTDIWIVQVKWSSKKY